jgi:hypothetical protein
VDFKGASVRVAWGKSGLGVRPVGSNTEGAGAGARRGAPVHWSAGDVAFRQQFALLCPSLTAIFSRNLNRSAQSGE